GTRDSRARRVPLRREYLLRQRTSSNQLPDYPITQLPDLFDWLDANHASHGAVILELHASGDLGKNRVVFADAGVQAGPEPTAALGDDDGAAGDEVAVVRLRAEPLRVRIAAVA